MVPRSPFLQSRLSGVAADELHQSRDSGCGRITTVRSKTVVGALGAVVAITSVATKAPGGIRPAWAGGVVQVFRLLKPQTSGQVTPIARATGLADWQYFSSHNVRAGMVRRLARKGAPTLEIERQGSRMQGDGMVGHYTRGAPAGSGLRCLYPKVIDDDQAAGQKNCADNPQLRAQALPFLEPRRHHAPGP